MLQLSQLFQTEKTTQHSVVVKLGSSHQALRTLKEHKKFVDFLVSTEQQKAFYDATNEIPANTEARTYAEGKNDELTTAVIKQFKNAQPMPNISQMSAVWDPAKTMLFDAVSGKKDAKTAANDAVTLIKETIKQKIWWIKNLFKGGWKSNPPFEFINRDTII